MLNYTSKRLLDKLLNKVWPDDTGINKSPVYESELMRKNAHTLFNYNRFEAGFVYAEVYGFKVTSL